MILLSNTTLANFFLLMSFILHIVDKVFFINTSLLSMFFIYKLDGYIIENEEKYPKNYFYANIS